MSESGGSQSRPHRGVVTVRDAGIRMGPSPDPCVMVLFGASGDLAQRELFPAIYELHARDLLPDRFAVVGFARTAWTSEDMRATARASILAEYPDATGIEGFLELLSFVVADPVSSAAGDYGRLVAEIARVRTERNIPDNIFFHLAVPPVAFPSIVGMLDASGLASRKDGWRRIVVEKPFGEDLASALELDAQIRRCFGEDQIYRIDHFLGKETVQNMLVFRFANPSFEPIWNRDHIDHVQITVAEDIGIGTRAAFYDRTGVVRDMVQNHLLQLLCMTAIEPPLAFDATSLRDQSLQALRAVNLDPIDPANGVVMGQYGPGVVGGEVVKGYRDEEGIDASSVTPTFVALKVTIDNWRWAGVPFYLRTGKRMTRKLSEVVVRFKPTPHFMFDTTHPTERGTLTFRLQPEEGILHTLVMKQPGPDIRLTRATMKLLYADAFGVDAPPGPYAWLLLDAIRGNQTLFARADWVYEAWKTVDPVIRYHQERPAVDYPNYSAGSWGPAAADSLLMEDGRRWYVE